MHNGSCAPSFPDATSKGRRLQPDRTKTQSGGNGYAASSLSAVDQSRTTASQTVCGQHSVLHASLNGTGYLSRPYHMSARRQSCGRIAGRRFPWAARGVIARGLTHGRSFKTNFMEYRVIALPRFPASDTRSAARGDFISPDSGADAHKPPDGFRSAGKMKRSVVRLDPLSEK